MTRAGPNKFLQAMEGPPARDPEGKTIDLQLHKLVRELEGELGGLFGIGRKDIEQAILRAQTGTSPDVAPRLPNPVERAALILDAFFDLAEAAAGREDFMSVAALLELLAHARARVERLVNAEE